MLYREPRIILTSCLPILFLIHFVTLYKQDAVFWCPLAVEIKRYREWFLESGHTVMIVQVISLFMRLLMSSLFLRLKCFV